MTIAAIDFQLLANAGFPPARFTPGEVIFAEGDKGDKMYVIRSGEVEIERDGKVVETLSLGRHFRGDGPDRRIAAGGHGAGQDGLRGRPDYREELPVPRARDAVLRHRGDAHARRAAQTRGLTATWRRCRDLLSDLPTCYWRLPKP